MSKEAKFIKDFDFLGFSRCFSLSIEQTSKNQPKMTQFGWILDVFEDFPLLAEKQPLKPRKLNSLMNFASLDAQLDPQVARLVEWNESGVKKPCVTLPYVWPSFGYKTSLPKDGLTLQDQVWEKGRFLHHTTYLLLFTFFSVSTILCQKTATKPSSTS